MKTVAAGTMALISVIGAHSQTLNDSEIQAAIVAGANDKTKPAAVLLHETPAGLGGLVASSGFSVSVFTPSLWIQQQAAEAAQHFKSFTLADVTDEMRAPILRVIAHPYSPSRYGAGLSVDHVVIRDARKTLILQPATKEPRDVNFSNALGGSVTLHGLTVTFPLDAIENIRKRDKVGEFWITVVSERGHENNIAVTRKHAKNLFWR